MIFCGIEILVALLFVSAIPAIRKWLKNRKERTAGQAQEEVNNGSC